MRITLNFRKSYRFYVSVTRKTVEFKMYSRRGILYRHVLTEKVTKNTMDYELSRWTNAGADLHQAFAYVLADTYELPREKTTAIIHIQY